MMPSWPGASHSCPVRLKIHLSAPGRGEYTKAGHGTRLSMIVLHDDGVHEYAYRPAEHPPDTKVGYFPQSPDDEAKKQGWVVISIKNDWKRVFAFE